MGKLLSKLALGLAALALVGLAPSVAKADLVVVNSASGGGPGNVNLNQPVGAVNTITGTTVGTNQTVTFTGVGGNIVTQGTGQASVQALSGSLTSLGFNLAAGQSTTFAVFKVDAVNTSNLTITVLGTGLDATANNIEGLVGGVSSVAGGIQFTIAQPASGFFTFTTINGQTISGITVAGGGGIEALQQVRIGAGPQVQPVPEPATMLLLGTGLAGVAAKVRRRRKAKGEAA